MSPLLSEVAGQDWRGGSAGMSACSSRRGLRISSQHLCRWLPGVQCPFPGTQIKSKMKWGRPRLRAAWRLAVSQNGIVHKCFGLSPAVM